MKLSISKSELQQQPVELAEQYTTFQIAYGEYLKIIDTEQQVGVGGALAAIWEQMIRSNRG